MHDVHAYLATSSSIQQPLNINVLIWIIIITIYLIFYTEQKFFRLKDSATWSVTWLLVYTNHLTLSLLSRLFVSAFEQQCASNTNTKLTKYWLNHLMFKIWLQFTQQEWQYIKWKQASIFWKELPCPGIYAQCLKVCYHVYSFMLISNERPVNFTLDKTVYQSTNLLYYCILLNGKSYIKYGIHVFFLTIIPVHYNII